VHRSNSSRSPLLRLIIFTAVAAALLGAIAAVPAHSLLSAERPSVAVRAQHGATCEPDSAYYLLPVAVQVAGRSGCGANRRILITPIDRGRKP
jgi:hypothetical protein